MVRVAVLIATFGLVLQACSDSSGAQLVLAMPAATRQALTGFDPQARAEVKLDVVCDDGRGGTFDQELSARVDTIGFFVPPCGQAKLDLTISGIYDDQDPVEAFNAQATAFLEGGKNADVEFTGIAYGELVLDPLGQPLTLCTAQDVGGLYEPLSFTMNATTVVVERVPAADYDVYCYDALSGAPNYQPIRVGAGQRTGPDLKLPDIIITPGTPPVLRDLRFPDIKASSVFVTFGFTTASIDTISFDVLIALDPQLTQLAQPPFTQSTGTLTIGGLTPQTHYYVRVSGSDANGSANTLNGDFETNPESLSSRLVNILINNMSLADFDPARQGYVYNALPTDTLLTIVATTEDPNAFVRVNSDAEVTHSATSEVPISSGTSHIFVYVRTFDDSSSRSYDIAVVRQ